MNITDSFANFSISSGQNLSRAPPPNQRSSGNPPLQGQQNLSASPLQQNVSGSPSSEQQNVNGPSIMGHHNLPAPPLQAQQNFGSPLSHGQQNMCAPPLQRQQTMPVPQMHIQQSGSSLPPQGQQSVSGPPVQMSGPPLQGQQSMPVPPMQGQHNALNSPMARMNSSSSSLQSQQNLSGPSLQGQQNMPGFQIQGQQNLTGPMLQKQQNLSGPPSQGQPDVPVPPLPGHKNLSGPPLQAQSNLPGPPLPGHQNLSGPPLPGQLNMSGPPLQGQQNLSSAPSQGAQGHSGPSILEQQNYLSQGPQSLSGPPLPGQQNLLNAPLHGQQNLSGLPPQGQQPLSGPPLSGPYPHTQTQQQPAHPYMEQTNMNATPLPGQAKLTGPPLSSHSLSGPQMPGQQNVIRSPLPGQQNLPNSQLQNQLLSGQARPQSQAASPGSGQLLSGQRPYGAGPPLPGQPATSPIGMNRTPPGYQQGAYQQPGYQTQQDMYSGQRNLYQGGVPSNVPGYQSSAQSQQARRLDPEQMPSPIQVIQDDQRTRGGVFVTNQRGLVPPLVTTKFITQDQGNASPRFIRSTTYTVPTTSDLMKQMDVPFGLILSPMACVAEGEYEPPIVDMGEIGPVRCVRCKAYMSPFMSFIDAGRRFQCMFCKATTEVPAEYFQHLDHTGQRMDRYERPELMLGTYEYIATKDYCRNNTFPKPPAIVFVIDVSYNTVKSGLVNLICMKMKSIIRNLPVDAGQTKSNMKVGFITYNNTVHFYNINPCLAQPQMMVVGDIQDVFMPLLSGFLCDVEESESLIDNLMTQIPTMFADTRETETILAPAIQAGLEALKASDCVGKLMVFHSSLPIAEAPGKLKNRDDRKVLGTDKEKTVLGPQNNVYNNLGQECVSAGCSVDLFVFNNSYVDIATIGQISRLTGGEVYKYTYFQADVDGDRLITDVIHNISRPIAFDAIMRVRTSTGVRPTDFYGHFFMSNTTDMELASIDCDKAVAVEIKHDDKLGDEEGVYIQAALLYTSCGGIRRLRIINLSLKTSSQMAELYRTCDLDAIINYFSKQSVFKLIESTPKAVKDGLISRCANMLAAYRKHCASPSSVGQLILPECMKLLPLYVNCLLKSDAIFGGADMTIDDRSFVMQAVATMPISISVVYTYPRLLPLHDVDPEDTELPTMLRCSIDKFSDSGAYLLENSIHMFLWLGLALSQQWVQEVFGVQSVVQVDTDRTALPVLDTPLNKRVTDIIERVRSERHRCMRLTIVRQRDKLEMVLRHFLVEDRGNDGSPSYVDFLCHMHKEIRTLLSQ